MRSLSEPSDVISLHVVSPDIAVSRPLSSLQRLFLAPPVVRKSGPQSRLLVRRCPRMKLDRSDPLSNDPIIESSSQRELISAIDHLRHAIHCIWMDHLTMRAPPKSRTIALSLQSRTSKKSLAQQSKWANRNGMPSIQNAMIS